MITLNHFFMNGCLPAICVFSQIQLLIQSNTFLSFLRYAKILCLCSFFQRKCNVDLGTGLKKWGFFRVSYFSLRKIKCQEKKNNALNFTLWMMRDKLQKKLRQILAVLVISAWFFQDNCYVCSAWFYWKLWCQAPNHCHAGRPYVVFLPQARSIRFVFYETVDVSQKLLSVL